MSTPMSEERLAMEEQVYSELGLRPDPTLPSNDWRVQIWDALIDCRIKLRAVEQAQSEHASAAVAAWKVEARKALCIICRGETVWTIEPELNNDGRFPDMPREWWCHRTEGSYAHRCSAEAILTLPTDTSALSAHAERAVRLAWAHAYDGLADRCICGFTPEDRGMADLNEKYQAHVVAAVLAEMGLEGSK